MWPFKRKQETKPRLEWRSPPLTDLPDDLRGYGATGVYMVFSSIPTGRGTMYFYGVELEPEDANKAYQETIRCERMDLTRRGCGIDREEIERRARKELEKLQQARKR